MTKQLQTILNTDLSAENVKKMAVDELYDYIIDAGIFHSVQDVNLFIVEGVQNALKEDDEFPIHYYDKEEDMPETSKVVDNVGEMLTDELISEMNSVN